MGFCTNVVADKPISSPEWAFIPEPPGYTVTFDKIFIPLATLKAAWRNQASNLSLVMVVNLARLVQSRKCYAISSLRL
jgi:hypothetical protein